MKATTSFRMSSQQQVDQESLAMQPRAAMLGLEDALHDIPGILSSMLVAFGKNGIRTVEDLAACATDDLVGWTECSGDRITMHPGILGGMAVSRKQCDTIILHARVRAGWIEPAAVNA
jgi:transcription termination/antitermination protein NusA